ncbi:LysR substrate-binding domain-containing protein [Wenjunlia tyrosinilytica]|uniref:LysR substrate-binding domain-containing protein n=1 Tax=Wenjunlia tyrosinilytica TaxID=1544741 RepID=A0A917ZTX6_9ACTN|nr:LysR substrate-binding domain-containing protein [Wenjunlia tyrosinilytica]GGO93319.1 hypothetical protein GCM10012280_45580 [Wenjunlia tyrosinilytica]
MALLHMSQPTLSQIVRQREDALGIALLSGSALDHMPAILRAFGEAYPEVSLEVEEFDFRFPEAGLDTGATDVAIVRPPVDLPTGSELRVLRSEPRVALLDSALLGTVGSLHRTRNGLSARVSTLGHG